MEPTITILKDEAILEFRIKNVKANIKTSICTVGISAPKIDSRASLPRPFMAKTDSVITEPPNLCPS